MHGYVDAGGEFCLCMVLSVWFEWRWVVVSGGGIVRVRQIEMEWTM